MAGFEEASSRNGNHPTWLASIWPNKLKGSDRNSVPAVTHDASQDYLTGLRGCIVVMTFLWVFLQTFAPATVKGSANDTGPGYQIALRKSLSVLFWNDELIYGSIIFLSARTICLPFLLSSTKIQLASSVFRRPIKLWLPTATALILCYIVFTKAFGGNQYLHDFADLTQNDSMSDDLYIMPSSLVNFNSIFNMFWTTHDFTYQAGNWAFPTQTLWIVSALYQQSYTVYAAMVVLPFTRPKWRLTGGFLFVLTAWWVYSWAWYSITGLMFADAVINMDLRTRLSSTLPVIRLPLWVLGMPLIAVGFAMQLVWTILRPDLANAEIKYHTGTYNTAGLYTWQDTTAPHLRVDIYLIIVGFHLAVEGVDMLRMALSNRALVYLGKRSFSWFLIQSIIAYSLGIKTVTRFMQGDVSNYPVAIAIAFITCLLTTIAAAELFYWAFDRATQAFACALFDWMRE